MDNRESGGDTAMANFHNNGLKVDKNGKFLGAKQVLLTSPTQNTSRPVLFFVQVMIDISK